MNNIENKIKEIDIFEVLNHLYDGIYITDGEGRTLFVNNAYCKITGISKDEVLGRKVKDISEEGKLYKGAVTETVLREKRTVSSLAQSLITGKHMLITGNPIFDENKNIKFVVVIDRDISELKKIENDNQIYMEMHEQNNKKIIFLNHQQISDEKICTEAIPRNIMNIIKEVACSTITVLILGEFGTGKNSLAQKIYLESNRKKYPFFTIQCNEYSDEELEKILFVSANEDNNFSLLELANNGTLYLSNIDRISKKNQIKLLKILDEKEIKNSDGKIVKLNVRFIFSSSTDLLKEVEAKKFSVELYDRINIISLSLLPLRKRVKDIEIFSKFFLKYYNEKYNKNISLTRENLEILECYDWPGNLTELKSFIERIVLSYRKNIDVREIIKSMIDLKFYNSSFQENLSLKERVQEFEKNIIIQTLNQCGNITKAALMLGISQPALSKKCKLLNITLKKS